MTIILEFNLGLSLAIMSKHIKTKSYNYLHKIKVFFFLYFVFLRISTWLVLVLVFVVGLYCFGKDKEMASEEVGVGGLGTAVQSALLPFLSCEK